MCGVFKKDFNMSSQTFPIAGMTCQHCVARVHTLISSIAGVQNVSVTLMPPRVSVAGEFDVAALSAALAGTQFSVGDAIVPTQSPRVRR
jgi:copper chaperone CopZ